MAKCDEGYRCQFCGKDVESLSESELYLRYVIGWLDPETLHTTPENHIRCNPSVAQFIMAPSFPPVHCAGEFDKRLLDSDFVSGREALVTRGWLRLCEIKGTDMTIAEYPLAEVVAKWSD